MYVLWEWLIKWVKYFYHREHGAHREVLRKKTPCSLCAPRPTALGRAVVRYKVNPPR